jgi:hypothetical protein
MDYNNDVEMEGDDNMMMAMNEADNVVLPIGICPPAMLALHGTQQTDSALPTLMALRKQQVKVGRHSNCDISFSGYQDAETLKWVSRSHCEFVMTESVDQQTASWAIQDSGSRYGTYVNGEVVPPRFCRILRHEDVITLGVDPTNPARHGPRYRFLIEGILTMNMILSEEACHCRTQSISSTSSIGQVSCGQTQQNGLGNVMSNAMSAVYKRLGGAVNNNNNNNNIPTPVTNTITPSGQGLSQGAVKRLNAELLCPVCQGLFVHACTLGCGHSFCSSCIHEWLRTCQACPICRTQVASPPVRSLVVDGAVEITLEHHADPATREEWLVRKQQAVELASQQTAAKNDLNTQFARALEKGAKIVSINVRWSEQEQARFTESIKHHEGEARAQYCAIVGLVPEFVASASAKDLVTAAMNVRLSDKSSGSGAFAPWCDTSIGKLRNRLNMYIYFG